MTTTKETKTAGFFLRLRFKDFKKADAMDSHEWKIQNAEDRRNGSVCARVCMTVRSYRTVVCSLALLYVTYRSFSRL